MRVGIGYDVHRFIEGSEVTIGGVKIPHSQGVLAHSDGDVLLHAICDALLGALALGDIGQHFPDTDVEFENRDSLMFLRDVYALIKEKNYRLVNLDSVVICERPKLASHIILMREKIASSLGVSIGAISVKATTHETMGALGREEGLAAQAIVCLNAV